jgi:hypothetical protein
MANIMIDARQLPARYSLLPIRYFPDKLRQQSGTVWNKLRSQTTGKDRVC